MSSTITVDSFGKTKNGEKVTRFTLTNRNKVTIRFIDYGCIITDVLVPDRNGKMEDISLGFDKIEDYEGKYLYFGAVIGRFCSRIAGGKFSLDGKEYTLAVNHCDNSLHGGIVGFDKVMWESKVEGDKVILRYVSKDGEEGYPGNLSTTVTYSLDDNNAFTINYHATTDKATPVNLTNHAYFNLAGHGAKNLDSHNLQIMADSIIEFGKNYIPTGKIIPVEGITDLRTPAPVADRVGKITLDYMVGENEKMKYVARLEHSPSGRALEIETTDIGLIVYTAELMPKTDGKNGKTYMPGSAITLEAQHHVDSVHHNNFPSTILRPGEIYNQTTVYRFVTLAE